MDSTLEGARALVTGAGRGIGRAIAMRLAAGGALVEAADLIGENAEETATLIRDAGGEAYGVKCDVTVQADVDGAVADAVDRWDGLDVLVNNAGVSIPGFIESVRDEDIERVFSVNLIGAMRVTRTAAPHLKKSERGRVVNISSVEGIRGSGLTPVYSASKAGVLGLTRSNAIELARDGITVNAVCPGPIDTDMLAPLLANEWFTEKLKKGVPMRRLGKPEDVAAAVAFFASADTSYVTGNILVVDGGMTVKAL